MAENTRRLQETQTREVVERERQTLAEGRAFLQQTMERRREREAGEREGEKREKERRLNAVLSLKRNTESSEVTLHIQCIDAWYGCADCGSEICTQYG